MKKQIILLVISALLISNYAYANGIDIGAAYKDAFLLVGLKCFLAYVFFYVLTLGLWGKEKDTALKNGRWFGGILCALVIASSVNYYSNQSEYIYSLCLAVIGYYVIGFVVGYLWFKFKKHNENKINNNNSLSKKHLQIIFSTIVVIGIGIFIWLFTQKSIGNLTVSNSLNSQLQTSEVHKLASLSSTKRYTLDDGKIIDWQNNKECYVEWGDKVNLLTAPIRSYKFRNLTQEDNLGETKLVVIVYFPNWVTDGEINAALDQQAFLKIQSMCHRE